MSVKKIAMRIGIKHVHTRSATTHREELKIEVINFAAIKNIIMSQLRCCVKYKITIFLSQYKILCVYVLY